MITFVIITAIIILILCIIFYIIDDKPVQDTSMNISFLYKQHKIKMIICSAVWYLCGLIVFPLAFHNTPTALDAYRGWTHLRVTVEECNILDTVVIYNADKNTPKKRRDAIKNQPVRDMDKLREMVQQQQLEF